MGRPKAHEGHKFASGSKLHSTDRNYRGCFLRCSCGRVVEIHPCFVCGHAVSPSRSALAAWFRQPDHCEPRLASPASRNRSATPRRSMTRPTLQPRRRPAASGHPPNRPTPRRCQLASIPSAVQAILNFPVTSCLGFENRHRLRAATGIWSIGDGWGPASSPNTNPRITAPIPATTPVCSARNFRAGFGFPLSI